MREDTNHMPTAESLVPSGQQLCCLKSQGPHLFSLLFYYGVYTQMLRRLTMSKRPPIPSMRIYGSSFLFVFQHKEAALSPFTRITRHWFLSWLRLTRNFFYNFFLFTYYHLFTLTLLLIMLWTGLF